MDIAGEDFLIPDYAEKSIEYRSYKTTNTVYIFDGYRVTENWIEEVWQGIYIEGDIFVDIGPKEMQYRSIHKPHKVRLGYHGLNYSNMNAENISLVDRMKYFQYLYFFVADRLEQFIAQDRAPVLHFDTTQVDPKIGLEKTLYYLDKLNIDFFNPLQNADKMGAYQRGKALDVSQRSTMQHINNYIQLLESIDNQISDVAGISPQREGFSTPYESVTNHQQSIMQSNNVTEIYFHLHTKLYERILNSILKAAFIVFKNNGIIRQYILDDLQIQTLMLMPDDLLAVDMGVVITSSRKELEIAGKLQSLIEYMMNSDQSSIGDVVAMIRANSSAEMQRILEDREYDRKKQEENLQRMQQEMQQKELEAMAQQEQANRDHELTLKQMELEVQLGLNMNKTSLDSLERQAKIEVERKKSENKRAQDIDKNEVAKMKLEIERERNKILASKKPSGDSK